MWILIATMLVMGHQHKIHAEAFDTQQKCEARKAYILEVAEQYGALIVVTCQTDA